MLFEHLTAEPHPKLDGTVYSRPVAATCPFTTECQGRPGSRPLGRRTKSPGLHAALKREPALDEHALRGGILQIRRHVTIVARHQLPCVDTVCLPAMGG
jgi:hypothetical protein